MSHRKIFAAWAVIIALTVILVLISAACGKRARQVMQLSLTPATEQSAEGQESGGGVLPPVMALDELMVNAPKGVRAESQVISFGSDYSPEGSGSTSDREYSIEVDGSELHLRAYEPGEYTYALFVQQIGDGEWGGGQDDDVPLQSLIDSEVCSFGGGQDDDIPLSYYVGAADYSAGSWRWFGPFSDNDETAYLNTDTLKNRFKSPNDNLYLAVLTASGDKAASRLPEDGLVGKLPFAAGLRNASQSGEDACGVTIVRVVTDADSGIGTVPEIVTGLVASIEADRIALSWDVNPDPDVTSYEIYRKEAGIEGPPVWLDSVAAPTTGYDDMSAEAGVTYVYGVQAVNDVGPGGMGYVNVGPPVIRGVSPTSGSEGALVKFAAIVSGSQPFTYEWDFGGGATPNTSTEARPIVVLGDPESYSGSLILTNAHGDDTFPFTLTVYEPEPERGDWWMFGREPTHNRRSPYVGTQTASLKWRYQTEGIVISSPAIAADGTIYAGSCDKYLYAVNPDGTPKWRYETGGPVFSSPAIGRDGTIYVGTMDNYLYAITDSETEGTLKWRYPTGDCVPSSPAIAANGTIYVGSEDNYLYAIKPDGTLKWRYETGWKTQSSPAIGADGTVYLGSEDGYLHAINSDGMFKWKYQTGDMVDCSPAIGADGTIYVGSHDCYLYAIIDNETEGTKKWEYMTEQGGSPPTEVILSSPAIGADGTIYVGSHDGYLYAIDPDGTLKWKYVTGGYVESSPAIGADGTVYVGSEDFYLYAITDSETEGTLKWRYQTGGYIDSSPAISADGTVYVGSHDGYLYAFNDSGYHWRVVTVDSEDNVGTHSSLAAVNGKPAISYFDWGNCDLKYVRASDPAGASWGSPITVDSDGDVGWDTSLEIVNGYPAISYFDDTNGDLKYVRATDANGSSWGTPVTVDSGGAVRTGTGTSLCVVNGNPAISYYDKDGNAYLKYVRATDANGASWGSPEVLDSIGSTYDCSPYTSLVIVNGNPAIGYYDETNGDLKYVRASDASGNIWGSPVTVDSEGDVGHYARMAIINGNPAISYYDETNGDLKYVRASDASGNIWGSPVTVDSEGDVGIEGTSLAIVNGYPAIGYLDATNGDLKYVRATDASGSSWGTPQTVDSAGVGGNASLAIVNGNPAISYVDYTNGNLKYAFYY